MRQKLRDLFNRHARGLKKGLAVAALGVTLGLSADAVMPQMVFPQPGAPEPSPVTRLNDGVTYWKSSEYDITIKVWPCEERGLCAAFHSIALDAKNRTLMAQLKGYGRPSQYGFGYEPDPERVQDWELSSYCGFEPGAMLAKKPDGSWEGTVTSPFNYKTYGIAVAEQEDGSVKVSGYFQSLPWLRLSQKGERVLDPAPRCDSGFPAL
jgi:hypothetical protein